MNNSPKNNLAIEILKEVVLDCLAYVKNEEIKRNFERKRLKENVDKYGILSSFARKILPLNVRINVKRVLAKAIDFYFGLKKETHYYKFHIVEKRLAIDFLNYVLEKNPEIPYGFFPKEDWQEITKFVRNNFYSAFLDSIEKEKLFSDVDLKKQKEIKNFLKQNPIKTKEGFYEFCGFKSIDNNIPVLAFFEGYKYCLELLRKKDFQNSIIIDAGAYIGDTAFLFARELNPKKIVAIEPDKLNFEYLQKNIKLNSLNNVEALQIGIGERRAKGKINLKGSGAYLSEGNDGDVDILTLDELYEDSEIPIGMIKMDIVGFELPAIKGAKNVIKKFNPILLIALYHKGQSFFEIPPLIKSWVPEYKFKFLNFNFSNSFSTRYLLAQVF